MPRCRLAGLQISLPDTFPPVAFSTIRLGGRTMELSFSAARVSTKNRCLAPVHGVGPRFGVRHSGKCLAGTSNSGGLGSSQGYEDRPELTRLPPLVLPCQFCCRLVANHARSGRRCTFPPRWHHFCVCHPYSPIRPFSMAMALSRRQSPY